MNIKKIIFDTTMIMIFLVLFFIWYNHKFEVVTVTTVNKPKIYLITTSKQSQFWVNLNKGVGDMADLLNLTYTWLAPENRNAQEQIQIINSAVEAGANAILLAVIDPVMTADAIKAAKEKGVKIIYVDSPAIEEAIVTLATENYSAGETAGELMLSELAELGINQGSIGIIGLTPETIAINNRDKGFREIITQDGRFTLLDTVYTRGDIEKSEAAAEKMFSDNPDLVGLFATSEGNTIGIGNAIQATNPKIVGIGFDYTEEIYQLLRKQYLNAVLVQNPYTMGYLGMAEAYAALNGYNTGPSYIDTGVTVITKYQPRRPLIQ
jgi:ribose transport system substrate-binding protein